MAQAIINRDAATKKIGDSKYDYPALDRQNFVRRGNSLWKELQSWLPTFKDLSLYIDQSMGFFDAPPNKGSKIDHQIVIDGHATMAKDTAASGMLTGLSSKARPWFKLGFADLDLMEYTPVKLWLDELTRRMYLILAKSNIYGALHRIYGELLTFASACCFLAEDYEKTIRARIYTAGEYAFGIGPDGKVNAFYRKFNKTVSQLVQEFGIKNCSQSIQTAYQNNDPDSWRKINLLIEENDERIPYLKDYKNMPYRAIYWEDSDDATSYLRLGGYEEFPLLCPRWDTITVSDIYGKGSPGWKGLGDTRMLQELQKRKFIALAKVGDPPVQKDSSVQGDVNTMPGGVTTFSALLPNAGLKPAYQVNPDIAAMEISIDKTKAAISRYFFADLFLMMIDAERTGRNITAYEIAEKQSEKLSILGPVLDRTEEEVHTPLINRLYYLMKRNGQLPELSDELKMLLSDMEITVQYISILAQAQKMVNVASMDQWTAGVMGDVAFDPSAADIMDIDAKNREKADMLGVPAKIVRSPEDMARIRAARAKQELIVANLKAAQIAADAAKKGAGAVKEMSQAPMGTGSALDSSLASMSGVQ